MAAILLISLGLGLGAAIGIPFLIDPKPLPVTGANPGKPVTVSVVSATGVAQAIYPDQRVYNLVTGMLLDATPSMQISTANGKVKIQLPDGTAVYVNEASVLSLVRIANPKQNENNTVVDLITGGILVENGSLSGGGLPRVITPGSGDATASGPFLGATYLPSQARLDVDCLGGLCQLSGSTAKRDLETGQHTWIAHGVMGEVDTARWSLWANLCDTDCSLLAQNGDVPPMTPTLAPTVPVFIPDLGFAGEVTSLPPLAQAVSADASSGSVSSADASLPGPGFDPSPTPTPVPVSAGITPAPTPGVGAISPPVPPTLVPPAPVPPSSSGSGSGEGSHSGGQPGLSKGGNKPPGNNGGGQGGGPGKGSGNDNGHKKPPKK